MSLLILTTESGKTLTKTTPTGRGSLTRPSFVYNHDVDSVEYGLAKGYVTWTSGHDTTRLPGDERGAWRHLIGLVRLEGSW